MSKPMRTYKFYVKQIAFFCPHCKSLFPYKQMMMKKAEREFTIYAETKTIAKREGMKYLRPGEKYCGTFVVGER